MNKQPCPHCKQNTISWWEKYKAAKFAIIYCPSCGGRICSMPYILPFYSILYVWDVLFFGFATYLDRNPWYLLVMLVIWLILDWFSLWFPLSALKSEQALKAEQEKEKIETSDAVEGAENPLQSSIQQEKTP